MLRGLDSRAVAERLRSRAARVPLALTMLLVAGVALRLLMWLEYRPAMMNNPDSAAYLQIAEESLFKTDPARPAGYPMFLRTLHGVAANVDLVIVLQHLLGIATALLLYATVRRVGAPVWAGLVAAAAVLLSLDQIQFEHTLQAEGPFTFGLALVCYGAVRSLEDPRRVLGPVTTRHLWIVGCGIVLGLAAWVRAIGVPLIPFLALWFALAIPGRWWERLAHAGMLGLSAGALVLVYFALNSAATGSFGLTRSAGWALYARTAPFADCTQFQPPAGTEGLCELSAPKTRPGPDYYGWVPGSPASGCSVGRRRPTRSSASSRARRSFTSRATTCGRPSVTSRVTSCPGSTTSSRTSLTIPYLDIDRRDRPVEADIERATRSYYPGTSTDIGSGLTVLTNLQQLLRVHPVLMLQALILGALGIWLGRGRVRAALALLLGAAVLGLAIPSATVSYNARYAVPFAGPLIAAGAIGLWLLLARLPGRPGAEHETRPAGAQSASAG